MINKNMIFDAHIHLNDEEVYGDESIAEMIAEGKANNVGGWLNASYDMVSSRRSIEIANEFEEVFAAIAIHPNEVSNHTEKDLIELNELAKKDKVVAIGETGLDYFYTKKDIETQKKFFKKHIQIAKDNNIVLQMHIRDIVDSYEAYDDVIEILKEMKPERMIVHCFSANVEYAQKFLDLGAYINIGGAVTFKNAKDLHESAAMIPLDKLLVETDAPYLTPHPFRGKTNYPKYIALTVERIAELKEIKPEEIINATTENALKLFNLI